jgi:hypothetical protein
MALELVKEAETPDDDDIPTDPLDPLSDQRTGLRVATTRRHLRLLRFMTMCVKHQQDPWTLLIKYAAVSSSASTQRTILASAIGAVKRQETYLHDGIKIPLASRMVQDRINWLDRQVRLNANLDLPASTLPAIRQCFNNLSNAGKLLLLLAIATGGHRGTSVRDLRRTDVFVRTTPAALRAHIQSNQHTATWLLQSKDETILSLRFRDGKTASTTGTYTMNIVIPDWAYTLLAELASKENRTTFLFGHERQATYNEVSRLLGWRELRRACLRYIAWEVQASPSDTRLFSRHTTDKALYGYLGGGLWSAAEAQATAAISSQLVPWLAPH